MLQSQKMKCLVLSMYLYSYPLLIVIKACFGDIIKRNVNLRIKRYKLRIWTIELFIYFLFIFSTDKFKLESEDVGDVTKIKIRKNNKGILSDWNLDKVRATTTIFHFVPSVLRPNSWSQRLKRKLEPQDAKFWTILRHLRNPEETQSQTYIKQTCIKGSSSLRRSLS